MMPEELNQTPDERLFELIDAYVFCDDAGRADHPPALSPFLTLDLLQRVHERIVHLMRCGACKNSKHRALAYALCGLMRVPFAPDERDMEKIGNHADIWLKRKLVDKNRQLLRNIRNQTNLERLRAELRCTCFTVSPMGRLEEFHGPFDAWEGRPRKAPRVPYTHSTLPPPQPFLELKNAANEAERKAEVAEMEWKRERKRQETERRRAEAAHARCKQALDAAASARNLAKSMQNERLTLQVEAARSLKEFARQARVERSRLEREAEQKLVQEKAKVLRLGSMVAVATQEAGRHAKTLEELHKKTEEESARAQRELRNLEAAVEVQRVERARVERESARSLAEIRGKVLRLGSQVAAASQEAAVHAHREADAVLKLEQERARVEIEAELRREEAAAERSRFREERRVAEQELNDARAKALRLGTQVVVAALEAGRLAQEKESLEAAREDQERELAEAEAQREYLEQKAESEAQARREFAKQCNAANVMRDAVKATSQRRLQAKKELEERVAVMGSEYDELREQFDEMNALCDANAGAAEKLAVMPTWQHERKQGRRGGGMQLQFQHRLAILEQHANGTPSSAIGKNIVSVVTKVAPWLQPVEPTRREIQQIGFELPTLEEALAARRAAAAFRVRLLGFDETSDCQDPVITSNIQVEDTPGAPLENVVLKAAYLATRGGTSEAVTSEIEEKCFARLRELLRMWREYHDRMFPDAQWTGPDPQKCSLHRLAGGGALMSDTCNGARKTKRLLTELIQKQAEAALRETHGDEEWEALTDDRRAELLRVYKLDCQHHLRNIWLGHSSAKQAAHVHAELEEELKQFSSWERMTTDFESLLRAVYKEFHHGGRYYKGKSADFASWLLEHYPTVFYMHIERADGGRQDLDFDAAVPIYVNRRYLVEYLHSLVFGVAHKNILEDFLYQTLMTTQYLAMCRANGLIDLRISRPHRWLAGKSAELLNWSPVRMNWVLDLIDDAYQKIRDDGSVMLDPEWDIFAPVCEIQPVFQEYVDFTYNHDIILSPNGRVRHLHYKLALTELLDPTDATNRRTRAKTIEYLQVQAEAALHKMYDKKLAIADKLTSQDGENSFGKQGAADKDLTGCNATNDATAEAVFGAWKLERRRNPGISVRRSSGLAQARISKSLAHDDAVRRRKQRLSAAARSTRLQRKSGMFGEFHKLPQTEQIALVEMCRAERQRQRMLDRRDWDDLHTLRSHTRRTNSELELESLIKNFAMALSFFDRYQKRGIRTVDAMKPELQRLSSTQQQLDWLREQIEMRVVGLGWIEFKVHWSSSADENVGSVADLTNQLTEILEEEQERQIPEAAPAPIMQRKSFRTLGTPTAQAEELAGQRLSMSAEQLLTAAVEERKRLEAAGILDSVGDLQPKTPPPLNEELVGRRLEIHWRYWRPAKPGERGKKKQVFIWCEGTVEEVSDGTIRRSARSKDSLPAGAVRIRWPSDPEYEEQETLVWSILNPADWCKEVHLGWRWAPSELSRHAGDAGAGSSA